MTFYKNIKKENYLCHGRGNPYRDEHGRATSKDKAVKILYEPKDNITEDETKEIEKEFKGLNETNKNLLNLTKNYELNKKLIQQEMESSKPAKANQIIQESSKAANTTFNGVKKISELVGKSGTTTYGTYPKMSDQEIQKRIQRINWERQYSNLVGDTKYKKSKSEKFQTGMAVTNEIVQTGAALAGVALTIATLATILKKTRGK